MEYQKEMGSYFKIWGSFHTLGALLPQAEYFETHPEYFALYEAHRIPDQLCLSNRTVQTIVADKLIALCREEPSLNAVTLGPQDNRRFCQCPRCRDLDEKNVPADQTYSRRLLFFYTSVARRFHAAFPHIILRFGCYDLYAAPPSDLSHLKIPPNTYPLICHYQKYCNNRPIEDTLSPENGRFREIVDGWRRLADDLFIYEYYYKLNWLGLPWPLVGSIERDIPWYRNHGVVGLYSQYNPNAAGSLLNYHVAAGLMANADADVDQLVQGFCREMFGPGWMEMRKYYAVLEKAMQECGVCIPGRGFAFPHAVRVFTDDVLEKCRKLLDHAHQKVQGTPYAAEVEVFSSLMDYTERCVGFLRLAVEGLGDGRLGVEIGGQGSDDGGQKTEDGKQRAVKARSAWQKGSELVIYLRDNSEKFEGVIPSPEKVNPYMQVILNELEKASRKGVKTLK